MLICKLIFLNYSLLPPLATQKGKAKNENAKNNIFVPLQLNLAVVNAPPVNANSSAVFFRVSHLFSSNFEVFCFGPTLGKIF